jgi:hypothetical protein
MHVRTILAAGITAAAVFATAFGGGGTGAAADAGLPLGAGAAVAPADAAAFVAIDSDLGSSQRRALDGLLAKIPGYDSLLTTLEQGFEQKTGLSWSGDVRPALGPELDVAVLPAAVDGRAQVALLTQPADPAKLDALLQKLAAAGGPAPVSARVGGWTVVSDSPSALAAVSGATSHLAGDALYQEAKARLAPEELLTAYANGAEARQLVSALGGSAGAGHVVWAAADAVASDAGLKVDGFVRSDVSGPAPYASSLVGQIPSGALLVADFQAGQLLGASPPDATSPLLTALGKVAGSLGGETAVYVSPGAPLPAVTLVTHPSDPQATLDALNEALGALGSAVGGAKAGGLDLGAVLSAIQLSHAQVGSALVVSTSQQAIDEFRGTGAKLTDDATFQEAQAASRMPARTTGFGYVNLKDSLPALQGLLTLAGAGSTAGSVDLSALRTLTAYGSGTSGGVAGFTAFLEVR